jgi:dipeptidyl aminopeptidase/acylaminoacyl peptidase
MINPFRKICPPYNYVALATLVCAANLSLTEKAQAAKVYKSRIDPNWASDGSHMWYRNDLAKGARKYVLVDFKKGAREPAFDQDKLAEALTEKGIKGVQADRLPIDRLQFDLSENKAFFRAKGKHFAWDRKSNQLGDGEPEEEKKEPAVKKKDEDKPKAYRPSRKLSPDGKWTVFVREHNLFVKPTGDGDEIQLSKDGKKDHAYKEVFWAADSNHLISFRVKPGKISEVHLIESSPKGGGPAKLHTRKYPLPGDPFTTFELNWFDLSAKLQVKPEVGLIDFRGPRLRWSPDGRKFHYLKIDRGHQRLRVIEFDTFTGKHRNVIDEISDTFIWTEHPNDLGVPLVNWMNKSEEIIYLSEKDGWRHLYLIDVPTGKITNPITQGEYVIRYVDRIDEEKRQIWFRASGRNPGQDPYLMHYYRVNFDGTGLTPLTEGNGWHKIVYSPDRKFIIDTYSRVDLPPVHELRRVSNGKLVCKLEQAGVSELEADGWKPPEVFKAKGRDGKTDIWGIVCRPADFDPKKKYPVLESMYAGPHDSYVPKQFSTGRPFSAWTDMGFVVVKMDGMGTANRSKAFHDICWHNLKDAGFPDRILWHQAFAKKNPWYDLTRVGIYGGSAGGQSSTGALLFHPEFYKVAVSSCGCHDNRMDKASWNEQWMGYPVGPHYSESSNIDNAHRLKGKLMLIVGELDRNVPPESTYRLVDALVRANKAFEFILIPGGGHGDGGRHGDRQRKDFFRKHLLGIEPPDYNSGR